MEPAILETNILTDWLGRTISYLRISLTDQCNYRCEYCYGAHNSDPCHSLCDEEMFTLIEAFSLLGVDKMRLTGGEPLLRNSLVDYVRHITMQPGNKIVGLTTNGSLLGKKLDELVNAGLNRLNISLDSLNKDTFHRVTGRDELSKVLESIDDALAYKVFPWIKVNTVVMRGVNDKELGDFAEWALSRRIDLRFIEYMPTNRAFWGEERFISEIEIREMIGVQLQKDNHPYDVNGPATRHTAEGYPGRISLISAMSHAFCKACNRIRLTSQGDIIGCLFGEARVSLVDMVRDNCTPGEIAHFIQEICLNRVLCSSALRG